jgi:hypothetical protein
LPHVGALLPGYLADFFVARSTRNDPYSALASLKPEDIQAVYIGGLARFERRDAPSAH